MTPKVGQLALNENCALVDLKKCKWRVSLDVENEENFECLFEAYYKGPFVARSTLFIMPHKIITSEKC